ncbi:MAG: hypothetical protein FWE16_04665 [Firmicutes bacterium]|nr:hypothetical protein [Bacillota bacterium]
MGKKKSTQMIEFEARIKANAEQPLHRPDSKGKTIAAPISPNDIAQMKSDLIDKITEDANDSSMNATIGLDGNKRMDAYNYSEPTDDEIKANVDEMVTDTNEAFLKYTKFNRIFGLNCAEAVMQKLSGALQMQVVTRGEFSALKNDPRKKEQYAAYKRERNKINRHSKARYLAEQNKTTPVSGLKSNEEMQQD